MSEFHCGPRIQIHLHQGRDEDTRRQKAVDEDLDKLMNLPAWNYKKVKLKAEAVRQARNDERSVRFASLMYLLPLEASRTWEASPEVQRKSCALGAITSRTTTDTEQHSPHTAHQLPRCLRWQEKQTTQYRRTLKCAWLPDGQGSGRKSAHKCVYDGHPVKDVNF